MSVIQLTTRIDAPRVRVFDLARCIEAHEASTERSRERAIAGRTGGLLALHETVTWEARHLGVTRRLTVRMTDFERPAYFRDEMLHGDFARMAHEHRFEVDGEGTRMLDRFDFAAPFGPLGRIADRLVLEAYMRRFLLRRNRALREMAEGETWRRFLEPGGKDGA